MMENNSIKYHLELVDSSTVYCGGRGGMTVHHTIMNARGQSGEAMYIDDAI